MRTIQLNSGFTLIEMLLVIGLFFLVGTFSSAFYSRFLTQSAVSNTQDQFVNQLRKAQIYAMTSRQNSNWGVRFGSNTLTLFKGNSYASRSANLDENSTINSNISVTGFTEVVFTRTTGLPSTTGNYSISAQGNTRGFSISTQGVIQR